MVFGKMSSGLLRPVCGTRQVLGVGDGSSDLVSYLVDGLVVGLVVGVERQVGWFSSRGDHAQPDTALVADVPGRRRSRWDVEQAAAAQRLGVVHPSVLGVGDPGQAA